MNKHLTPDELRQLSVEDRLQLIEDVWASLEADEDTIEVPEWHKQILDERLAEFERHPDEGQSWDEVKADILARLRR